MSLRSMDGRLKEMDMTTWNLVIDGEVVLTTQRADTGALWMSVVGARTSRSQRCYVLAF